MHVIFVEPRFPANQRQFVRGLREVGAPRHRHRRGARSRRSATSCTRWLLRLRAGPLRRATRSALLDAVRRVQQRGWVDRLEATVEAHILPAAQGARGLRHPRHLGADRLPLPRQAGDEGGAARGRHPHRAVDRRRRPPTRRCAFAAAVGFPLIVKPRAPPAPPAPCASTTTRELEAAIARERPRPRRRGRRRGVHRGPRGLLRHAGDRRPRRPRVRLALLPERARGDAHALDLAADRHHEPRRRRRATTSSGEMGAKVIAGARHRHLGDAHGVVLRPQGPQVLARSAAARRASACGTSTPPPTTSTSTASGATRSSTASRASALAAATPPA